MPTAFGATLTTSTVSFGPLSGSNTIPSSESVPNANGSLYNFETIAGLAKFDPAEGTLTAIRITASFDYSTNVFFESSGIINPGVTHTAGVGGLNHDLGLNLTRTSNPGVIYSVSGFNASFPQSYEGVGNPGEGDAYSESYNESSTLTNTADIFADVDLTDFIGVGEVTALRYGIFTPVEATFSLVNVSNATIDFSSMVENGTISIEYDFVPIPETSSALMLSLGLGIAVSRRRRGA